MERALRLACMTDSVKALSKLGWKGPQDGDSMALMGSVFLPVLNHLTPSLHTHNTSVSTVQLIPTSTSVHFLFLIWTRVGVSHSAKLSCFVHPLSCSWMGCACAFRRLALKTDELRVAPAGHPPMRCCLLALWTSWSSEILLCHCCCFSLLLLLAATRDYIHLLSDCKGGIIFFLIFPSVSLLQEKKKKMNHSTFYMCDYATCAYELAKKWPARARRKLFVLLEILQVLVFVWMLLTCLWISNALISAKRCALTHSLSYNNPQQYSSKNKGASPLKGHYKNFSVCTTLLISGFEDIFYFKEKENQAINKCTWLKLAKIK